MRACNYTPIMIMSGREFLTHERVHHIGARRTRKIIEQNYWRHTGHREVERTYLPVRSARESLLPHQLQRCRKIRVGHINYNLEIKVDRRILAGDGRSELLRASKYWHNSTLNHARPNRDERRITKQQTSRLRYRRGKRDTLKRHRRGDIIRDVPPVVPADNPT